MSKIVFLGDSITEGFVQLNQYKNIINMGISGNRTYEVLNRLDQVINEKPDELFLMIGINDIFMNAGVWHANNKTNPSLNYEKIVKTLKKALPNTKFYLQAILPVNRGVLDPGLFRSFNEKIVSLNKDIEIISRKYQVNFIDYTNNFKDENNNLKLNYTTDGVHLNEKGYELMYSCLSKYL